MSAESDRLLRERIGAKLDAHMTDEQLTRLFDEVLESRKQARGWCKDCKKAVFVEIPDAKAVTSALLDLANQSFGTPGRAADPVPVVEEFVVDDFSVLSDADLRRIAG